MADVTREQQQPAVSQVQHGLEIDSASLSEASSRTDFSTEAVLKLSQTKNKGKQNQQRQQGAKHVRVINPVAKWRELCTELRSNIEVKEIEGRGYGIVATKYIKAGTVILLEQPLVSYLTSNQHEFTHNSEPNMILAKAILCHDDAAQLTEALLTSYVPGNDETHSIFLSRSSMLAEDATEILHTLQQEGRSGWGIELTSQKARNQATRLLAIMHLNAFSLVSEVCPDTVVYAFYLSMAFCNHSCRANACHYIDLCCPSNELHKATIVLRATSDILPGQEVCISYIELMDTTLERQDALRTLYYFDCVCEHCTAMTSSSSVLLEEQALFSEFRKWLQIANSFSELRLDTKAAKAWSQCAAIARRVYPPNWPTLPSLYKKVYNAYKRCSAEPSILMEWRTAFSQARTICRGPQCATCQAFLTKPKLCSRCRWTAYCSPTCQRKDWHLRHKRECGVIRPSNIS